MIMNVLFFILEYVFNRYSCDAEICCAKSRTIQKMEICTI